MDQEFCPTHKLNKTQNPNTYRSPAIYRSIHIHHKHHHLLNEITIVD